ncbi:type II secretion system protein [candidate division KSB1 bacterium]|nr:type II secretion system protein [candidate division KSB1 bacterium]NIR68452.1 type II secretion system protein [candidate division KSB1 bacterium]NIS25103.1 type II secretion system protein [candidate division KSB1 bacterium]NIT72015.1 type II secretion system protein [candidate division KSB1 bacterium]NIU25802.1 type II secretion system protein [candidate division KSB1 bacterium]
MCVMQFGKQTGFSLVELIAVLVVVGILAIMAAAVVATSNSKLQYGTLIRRIATDARFCPTTGHLHRNGNPRTY